MMEAKVKVPFKGKPDRESHSRQFRPGDTVTGDLARVAVLQGWATQTGEVKKKKDDDVKSSFVSRPAPASPPSRSRTSRKRG